MFHVLDGLAAKWQAVIASKIFNKQCLINETLLLYSLICYSHAPHRGRGRSNRTTEGNWLLGHTRRKLIWVTTLHLPPFCWVEAGKQKQNTDSSGKTWVAGKAEPISPRVAASLGEPML